MFEIPKNKVNIDAEAELDQICKEVFEDRNFANGPEYASHTVYIEDYADNFPLKKIHRENIPALVSRFKDAGYFCNYEYNKIRGNCYGVTITKTKRNNSL